MAISIADVKYTPDPMVPGSKVKVTCKVTADEGVESVKIDAPDYQTLETYDDGTHGDDVAGDGIYTRVGDVPYDAPPGTYYVTVVATDEKGNVERKTVPIRIG